MRSRFDHFLRRPRVIAATATPTPRTTARPLPVGEEPVVEQPESSSVEPGVAAPEVPPLVPPEHEVVLIDENVDPSNRSVLSDEFIQ